MPDQQTSGSPSLTDLLFEEAGVGLCLVAPDGTVVRANAEWLRSTGFAAEQVVGEDIIELFPETRDMAAAMHARARAGRRVEVPRHAQTVNGRETWWEGRIAPVTMDGGTGLLITAREVSPRSVIPGPPKLEPHEREGRLIEGDWLVALIDSLPDDVFFVGSDGSVRFVNDHVRSSLGVSELPDVRKRLADVESMFEVYTPDGRRRPAGESPLLRALRGETAQGDEVVRNLETGELRHRQYRVAPVRMGGEIIGAVSLVRDTTDRARLEAALRENERNLRGALERQRLHVSSTPLGLIEMDSEYRVIAYSERAHEILGWSAEDVLGKRIDEIPWVPNEDWPSVRALLRDMLAGARPANVHANRNVRKDGRIVRCEWYNSTLRDEHGRLESVLSFVLDVTARREAEDELRRGEERLRLALLAARMVAWEYDPATKRVSLSENGQEVLPLPSGHVHSTSDLGSTTIHPDDVEQHRGLVNKAIATGGSYTSAYRQVVDGQVAWLEERARAETDGSGATVRLVGVTQNITDRKRAEALSDALAAIDLIIHSAHDVNEVVQTALRQASAALGTETAAVSLREGEGWVVRYVDGFPAEVVGSRMVDEEEPHAVLAIREQQPVAISDAWNDPRVNREHMRKWNIRAVLVVPLVVRGVVTGVVFFNHHRAPRPLGHADVRFGSRFAATLSVALENAQLLTELRQAGRRKDEFLAMLSHELRNPLAPIRNSAYILRLPSANPDQVRRAHEVIERQSAHLTRLVDDLLDVTRIARGKIEIRKTRVDLRELVLRAGDDFRLLLRDRGVALEVLLPEHTAWADADATRVTQLAANLLHNSSKFTRSGDSVLLQLAVAGERAELCVRDTGAGIDPELLPTLFEPFVQGDRTLARTEGGLGLGLALVKGIAELHNGTVRALSAGIGQGAEFTVSLPLAADESRVRAARPETGGDHCCRRVLVIEDNPDAAQSLADLVVMFGHSVEVAHDGPSALEKARAAPPDIILCDLGLPGMSGFDVGRALRALLPPTAQLIALSGYAQPEDVRQAAEAGFDRHLAKPADPRQIERLLGGDLQPRRANREPGAVRD